MEFGTKIVGKTAPIPKEMLTESVIGSHYEIRMKTSPIQNRQETARRLVEQLEKRVHGLKVNWINVEYDEITMQITGSPFAWSTVLLLLPEILGLLGIALIVVGVYLIFAQVPGWVIGIIVVGAALLFVGPAIGSLAEESLKTMRTA